MNGARLGPKAGNFLTGKREGGGLRKIYSEIEGKESKIDGGYRGE